MMHLFGAASERSQSRFLDTIDLFRLRRPVPCVHIDLIAGQAPKHLLFDITPGCCSRMQACGAREILQHWVASGVIGADGCEPGVRTALQLPFLVSILECAGA